jgi:hypothetical protein
MPPLLWAGPSVWRLSPAEYLAVAAGKGSWFKQEGEGGCTVKLDGFAWRVQINCIFYVLC